MSLLNKTAILLGICSILLTGCQSSPLPQGSNTLPHKKPHLRVLGRKSPLDHQSTAKRPTFLSFHKENLWQDIQQDFQLPDYEQHPAVQNQIRWYVTHPKLFNRICTRAAPYIYYVKEELKKNDMPSELALLPVIESSYDPFVYSRRGAAGIWQIMPFTANQLGLKRSWWYDGRKDVYSSTKAALNYLHYLHEYFHGDWLLAMAAYDSGEGTISNAIKRNYRQNRNTDFWSLRLSQETTNYVPRLLAVVSILRHREKYPLELPEIKNEPYFKKVTVHSQISLRQAAELANVTLRELSVLNPGFSRLATDPRGPHRLLLPVNNASIFKANLAQLPEPEHFSWIRHQIKRGETLAKIARMYGTSISFIKRLNNLRSHYAPPGRHLLVPANPHPTNSPEPNKSLANLYRIPTNLAAVRSGTHHFAHRHARFRSHRRH